MIPIAQFESVYTRTAASLIKSHCGGLYRTLQLWYLEDCNIKWHSSWKCLLIHVIVVDATLIPHFYFWSSFSKFQWKVLDSQDLNEVNIGIFKKQSTTMKIPQSSKRSSTLSVFNFNSTDSPCYIGEEMSQTRSFT